MNLAERQETLSVDFKHLNRQQFEDACAERAVFRMVDSITANCRIIDHWIFVDVRDLSLAPHLMRRGLWESWITIAFLRDLNRKDKFLDVGANFGWYSLMAHMAGADVVGAVEASKRVSQLLQKTFQQNHIHGQVFPYAAWSYSGVKLHLANDHNNQGGASVMSAPDTIREFGEEVETRQLDDFDAGWPIDVIKIDVESSEMEVWRGMKGIRERNKNLRVWMEFTPCGQSNPLACLQEIEKDGFEIREVSLDSSLVKRPLEQIAAVPEWTMLYLRRPN